MDELHSRVPVYDPKRGPEYIIGIAVFQGLARLMHFRHTAGPGLRERPSANCGCAR